MTADTDRLLQERLRAEHPVLQAVWHQYRTWLAWCHAERVMREIRECEGCNTTTAVTLTAERLGRSERWVWKALRKTQRRRKKHVRAVGSL